MRTTDNAVSPPPAPLFRPGHARPAYGRYGALQDTVAEDDMKWDIEGPNGDPMEDFGIS